VVWPSSMVPIYVYHGEGYFAFYEGRSMREVILQFLAHFQIWTVEAGLTQSDGPFLFLNTLYFLPKNEAITRFFQTSGNLILIFMSLL